MFAWIQKFFATRRAQRQLNDAINANYTISTNDKTRLPLEPENDPWRS